MSAPYPDFQNFQHAFARHVRAPWQTPYPAGVDGRAMRVYSELLFNKLRSFLDACFPVCRKVIGERGWTRLCRTFYRDWPQRSPWFREIPHNFVCYLQEADIRQPRPAWLSELAHYEWIELTVDLDPAEALAYCREGDLLQAPLVLNPSLRKLSYAWPVQRIGPDYRPRQPRSTHLLVYRNAAEEVQFVETNALTNRLLELLASAEESSEKSLRRLAEESGYPAPEQFILFGAGLLRQLLEQGVILGVRAP